MSGKTKLLAFLLFSAGFLMLALALISGKASKNKADQNRPEIRLVSMVVASQKITAGKPITSSQLEVQKVEIAQANAFSDPAAVIGKTPLFSIERGAPITNRFFEAGAVAAQVRLGYRAFALRLDDNNSATGKIRPGDTIDIFSVFRSRSAEEINQTLSRLIAAQLRVLAVGKQVVDTPDSSRTETEGRRSSKPRPERAITVEVETGLINTLALAQDQGELFAVIRNPEEPEAPDLEKYPGTTPLVAQLKSKTNQIKGVKPPQKPLSPINAAYAGVGLEDVVLPGSKQRNARRATRSRGRGTGRALPRTVEVIRAGESTREALR